MLTTHLFILEIASFSFYTKIKKEKRRKRRRFIGGESEEESENVRWFEEMRKFGGVFIGGDCNIGYIYHKYSQKSVKHSKKT